MNELLHSQSTDDAVRESDVSPTSDVVRENLGRYGAVCFVVRRPGCGLCREEGMTLTSLDHRSDLPLEGFGLFGVVKETGVDNKGLTRFFTQYFPHPVYRDGDMAFFKALGNRKLNLFGVISLIKSGRNISKRLKEKKIETNFKGEGVIQGGIIIFGKDGKPKYYYCEETGQEVPVKDIISAVHAVKAEFSKEAELNKE